MKEFQFNPSVARGDGRRDNNVTLRKNDLQIYSWNIKPDRLYVNTTSSILLNHEIEWHFLELLLHLYLSHWMTIRNTEEMKPELCPELYISC